MKRITFLLTLLSLLLSFCTTLFSDEKTPPTIESIINNVQKATDPLDITLNLKTKVQTGVVDMPAQKFKANVTVKYALPNKCRITSTLGNGEKIVQIINGEKAWEIKKDKVRDIKGEELKYLIFNASLDSFRANWKEIFSNITFEKDQDVNGRNCYVITCTPAKKFGIDTTVIFFVDKKDFLIKKTIMSAYSQAGILKESVIVDEYKEMNNVMIPVVTQTDILGAKIIYTIKNIEFNTKLDSSLFEPPSN